MSAQPDLWRARFRLVGLFRLYGLALVALGLVVWRTDWVGGTNAAVGRVVVAAGAAVLFLAPALLKRRWRRA